MEEKSWRSNHGGHLEAEAPRRHPGGTQQVPRRRPEAPKRHPEIPRRPPGDQRGLWGKMC